MMGQHQDADSSAVLLPDGVRGGEPFHRVGGRHPYVQDGHVRASVAYELKQRVRVRSLADHLEPGEGQQLDQAGLPAYDAPEAANAERFIIRWHEFTVFPAAR